jgi:N-formylglutamate amidohydrolase
MPRKGYIKRRLLLILIGLLSVSCSKSNDSSEVSNEELDRNWEQYTIFKQGNIPLLLISVHGGDQEPDFIEDRTCSQAVTVKDLHTLEITQGIEAELLKLGYQPYVVINKLHRKKIDLNRSVSNATCGNPITSEYWQLFHDQIKAYRSEIETKFSSGLVLDVHGHAHEVQRIELGYLLSATDLRQENETLNELAYKNKSSIRHLTENSTGLQLSDYLNGAQSFGQLFEERGYPSVPSLSDRAPKEGEAYWSGGYNTQEYGSRYSGDVDAIQVELNMTNVRDNASNRSRFTRYCAEVIVSYLESHYE